MPLIRLTRITSELAAIRDRDAPDFESRVNGRLGDNQSVIRDVIHQTLAMPAPVDDEPWGGHLVVDVATGAIIGICAFKSRPTDDGIVEIAYFTFPAFERRGYATAMAERLIAVAFASESVRCVVAHTLPERNASTRVLEKVEMQCMGEVTDPDEGRVWRWQRRGSGA